MEKPEREVQTVEAQNITPSYHSRMFVSINKTFLLLKTRYWTLYLIHFRCHWILNSLQCSLNQYMPPTLT